MAAFIHGAQACEGAISSVLGGKGRCYGGRAGSAHSKARVVRVPRQPHLHVLSGGGAPPPKGIDLCQQLGLLVCDRGRHRWRVAETGKTGAMLRASPSNGQ